MQIANVDGWLFEVNTGPKFAAWISDPERFIVGFARSEDRETAMRLCMIDAKHHCGKAGLVKLEKAVFGKFGVIGSCLS